MQLKGRIGHRYRNNCLYVREEVTYISLMKTVSDLGEFVAASRRALGLNQNEVARQVGISRESLVRFERGQLPEFGTRKLLAVLAVLGLQIQFQQVGISGSLDQLRRERRGG
jgi:HTH-type transcriptional regulator/antitoxin HipB